MSATTSAASVRPLPAWVPAAEHQRLVGLLGPRPAFVFRRATTMAEVTCANGVYVVELRVSSSTTSSQFVYLRRTSHCSAAAPRRYRAGIYRAAADGAGLACVHEGGEPLSVRQGHAVFAQTFEASDKVDCSLGAALLRALLYADGMDSMPAARVRAQFLYVLAADTDEVVAVAPFICAKSLPRMLTVLKWHGALDVSARSLAWGWSKHLPTQAPAPSSAPRSDSGSGSGSSFQINTPRLTLTAITEPSDQLLREQIQLYQNEEVTQRWGPQRTMSAEECARRVAALVAGWESRYDCAARDEPYAVGWRVGRLSDGAFLGFLTTRINQVEPVEAFRFTEVGIALAPESWSNGVATEAVFYAVRFLHSTGLLLVDRAGGDSFRFYAKIHPDHRASLAVKNKFREAGCGEIVYPGVRNSFGQMRVGYCLIVEAELMRATLDRFQQELCQTYITPAAPGGGASSAGPARRERSPEQDISQSPSPLSPTFEPSVSPAPQKRRRQSRKEAEVPQHVVVLDVGDVKACSTPQFAPEALQ
eukprot:m51a1_g9044 hypothetical protein (533) ;mRNA; r:9680-11998